MKAAGCFLLAVALAAAAPIARAGRTPHDMTLPDGSLDMKSCAVCHKPDMSLERSPLETCTLCHSEATHSGSLEHVRASAEAVSRVLATRPEDAVKLPLSKEGTITCITCHLYHDPAVLGETLLEKGWIPPEEGLPGAVRRGVLDRWAILERAYDKTDAGFFVREGTRQIRLPVADGSLCRQCHGSLR